MDPRNDEQTELLRLMWGEMKAVRSSIDTKIDGLRVELVDRMDRLRVELVGEMDRMRVDVSAGIEQTNMRLGVVESRLVDLAAQQVLLGRYMKRVVGRHDEGIVELRDRVSRLEERAGIGNPDR